MAKLQCIATCYMPSAKKDVEVERYEDEPDEDVYEVSDKRVDEFVESGNFVLVAESDE